MRFSFLIICILLLNSCKNDNEANQNTIESTIEINQKKEAIEFENKLKNESKIFLKFWEGMNLKEYLKVKKMLLDENVLEDKGIFGAYRTGRCASAIIEPIFEDNKLIKLELSGEECVYSLFKEKYNLPSLIERKYFKSDLNNLGAKTDTNLYKELVLPQHKPFTYEEGEIVKRGNTAIRIEHSTHKLSRTGMIRNKNYNFSANSFPSYGGSLGEIIFTYMSKEQFMKEDNEMKKAIEMFNNDGLEREKRENISKDEI